jgi:hypothetical protein
MSEPITVFVKMLSGDILTIECPPDMTAFYHATYDAIKPLYPLPHLPPLHHLVLLPDRSEEEQDKGEAVHTTTEIPPLSRWCLVIRDPLLRIQYEVEPIEYVHIEDYSDGIPIPNHFSDYRGVHIRIFLNGSLLFYYKVYILLQVVYYDESEDEGPHAGFDYQHTDVVFLHDDVDVSDEENHYPSIHIPPNAIPCKCPSELIHPPSDTAQWMVYYEMKEYIQYVFQDISSRPIYELYDTLYPVVSDVPDVSDVSDAPDTYE